MRRKALVFAILLSTFIALVAAPDASAATVRGRVIHSNGGPAVNYAVTITSPQRGRSSPVNVRADGMYYLFNIPPGPYRLEVWIPGQGPRVYQIQVHESYTDVPQVAVP
jgi:hypothetical protein